MAVRFAPSSAELRQMSSDQLAQVSAEQVLGMSRDQFHAFEDMSSADPATFEKLSPQVKRAVVRKNFYLAILAEVSKAAENHAKW